jgi:hypothetical protein
MRLPSLLVAVALAAVPASAAGEAVLKQGMEQTLGWAVYDAKGQLGFADCAGRVVPLSDGGSFQAADRRCPGRPTPFRISGRVQATVPERSQLELVDDAGAVHRLYLSTKAATELAKLAPGAAIEVEGPVQGHAATVQPRP